MFPGHSLPAEVLRLVENAAGAVLLHDASQASSSRLFLHPLQIIQAHSVADIPSLFQKIECAIAQGQYAAGWFAYECGAAFEPRAGALPLPGNEPLAWFGIYERCYRFDPLSGSFPEGAPEELSRLAWEPDPAESAEPEARIAIGEEEYSRQIEAIHGWIRSGDIYQLNYTIPLDVLWQGGAAELYQRLIRRQPVAYAAYLHPWTGRHLLSFSPELFFRTETGKRRILARPMKGTTARGRFQAEDQARASALQADAKNRAENLMIVDLLRNDLGRLCQFGSVDTEFLFSVERHPTLWQMTSTVRGELRPEVSYQQIFRALFPCGSITGAPKVRAMQLIGELEGRPRGVYTGSIGFFSREESVFNVAIRTLDLQEDGGSLQGKMGVGGGIVIDSDSGSEYRECLLKASFLTGPGRREAAVGDFELIETMRWQQGIAHLELHLDRLQASAAYFDFRFARDEVRAEISTFTTALPGDGSYKVRLLLNREGRVHLQEEHIPLPSDGEGNAALRVVLWPDAIDSQDLFYFHKTTHRPLYTHTLQRARQAGFDDVLFVNERGELTESCIGNLFVQMDGRLWTPPVECGLLAGVERRHLLATRQDATERVLTHHDLLAAEGLFLANAVRGLRQARLMDCCL